MKKKTKKLGLTRETLTNLNPESLEQVAAQAAIAGTWFACPCQASVMVCSVRETCVSCNNDTGGTIIVAAEK